MKEENKVKKPANATGLNSDRPGDVKAIENLRKLVEVVPGLSNVNAALRWLCEEEVPQIIEKYKKINKALKAS